MDARTPWFLTDHVDFTESRVQLEDVGSHWIAHVNGVLRGLDLKCSYIAKVPCDENCTIRNYEPATLELDLYVPELADLDVRLSELARIRDSALAELWLDDEVRRPWLQLDDSELVIVSGSCTFSTQLAATDRDRMRTVVELITALVTVPARRADQLAVAVEAFGIATRAQRLRLDEPVVVLAGQGAQLELAYGRDKRLRTIVRAAGEGELAVSEDGLVLDPARLRAMVAALADRVSAGDRSPYR